VHVLVVNAGSSSLKLGVVDGEDAVVASDELVAGDAEGLDRFLGEVAGVGAVGHRVVHGGDRFTAPQVLDDRVEAELRRLVPLAPLHQPAALAGIAAVRDALPELPAVACFDTAFHASLPAEATTYPLPAAWRERFGLRRYGFHGLSHANAARRAAALVGEVAARRTVTCHLGAGSSLAAVVDGSCVDTTMGFTPNEGLPMATRSGSVDVGMLTWLLGAGVGVDELTHGLQHEAGLVGLTGTPDMRQVLAASAEGDRVAALAVDAWLHRLAAGIAAMAASAQGIDALVFTGGIGERSAALRSAAADRLGWLGVSVDAEVDAARGERDGEVTAAGARVRTLVVRAREDLEVARGVREALAP
jgi:acetate kinase